MTGVVEIIRAGDKVVVTAELVARCTAADFNAAEAEWGPLRRQFRASGESGAIETAQEHGHWNWGRKAPPLSDPAFRGIALKFEGRTQGLMLVRLEGIMSRLDAAPRPLVYIEFIEVAPWNLRGLFQAPEFSRVGTALFREAVRLSESLGFEGRVGLHSLPQSEEFYSGACAMTRLGVDRDHEGLAYFERAFGSKGG